MNQEILYYKKMQIVDLPIWEKLAVSEFLKEDFCSEKYLLNQWDKTSAWILMNENNEWIGCSFIDKKSYFFNNNGAHFLEICVFPKFRNKGYSKFLLKLMFDNSLGQFKSACINPNNNASITLLTKYGFKKILPYKTWDVYTCNENYYPEELSNLKIVYKP